MGTPDLPLEGTTGMSHASSQTTTPLISELAGETDLVNIVQMFIDELPARLAAMSEALGRQDYQTIARCAHQLKGSAGGHGFPIITQVAADLERTATLQQDLNKLATEINELAILCGRARATPE